MKKLEYQQLKAEGLSELALEVYNCTEPLNISKAGDGYVIDGVVKLEVKNIEELSNVLESLFQ